ncbi:MAG: DUF86 domain-containing protein [Oscillatoria sp. SIO1A7]|nr:DUF86 domain-containing protein [Oscillatoria sp. SIO1A7]
MSQNKSRNETSLLDAARAAKLVQEFISGMEQTAWLEDIKTQSAVLYQITVLGEAVNRLSEDFCNQHSGVPWAAIVGMRNRIVHEYDDIDLEIIWETAQESVPEFLEAIEPLLSTP